MIREDIDGAIEVLRTQSCTDCACGCDSMITCTAKYCELRDAVELAVDALHQLLKFLDAGYKNETVEFYIGGRKFSVKELAQ